MIEGQRQQQQQRGHFTNPADLELDAFGLALGGHSALRKIARPLEKGGSYYPTTEGIFLGYLIGKVCAVLTAVLTADFDCCF
jgi:hypothetical protein